MHTAFVLAIAYVVTTIAGVPGSAGHRDGPAAVATFNEPTWVDVVSDLSDCGEPGDDFGTIVVIDRGNQAVRLISRGSVSTFTPAGYLSTPPYKLDFGERFGGGVMVEPHGSGCGCMEYERGFFVSSTGNGEVPLFSFIGRLASRDEAIIFGPSLVAPAGIARSPHYSAPIVHDPVDRVRERFLYIADAGDHTIRRSSWALDFEACPFPFPPDVYAGQPGISGSADGAGRSAKFQSPHAIVTAPDGALFVADSGNHTIRRIDPDGNVTTVAGEAGVPGSNDGPAHSAHFNTPVGLAIDARGELFIADTGNHTIRMLTPDGTVVTIAGTAGVAGFADGIGGEARFSSPAGLQLGTDGSLIVADTLNHVVRVVSPVSSRRRAVRR